MSQHDYIINNATFPNVRSDLNLALGAVATNNAGDDAPSTTYANQWWFDSNGNTLYMRNKDNDAWVTILTIGATSDAVTSIEGASSLAGIDDQSSSNDDQITITDTAVIINEDSDDLDVRIESNGNANMFFVDGGNNRVGVGTASPAMLLDVQGAISAGAGTDEHLQQWNIGSDNVKAEIKYVDADATRGYNFGTSTGHNLNLVTNDTQRINIDFNGNIVFNEGSANADFRIETNNETHAFFLDGANDTCGFNESSPDATAGGATFNQGADDNNIISFKSSDIAHGITGTAETDTFAFFRKHSATNGGLSITALSEGSETIKLNANPTEVLTDQNASTKGTHTISVSKKSGTGTGSTDATSNLLSIANHTNTRFHFRGDGNFYADAGSNTFDEFEDAHLVRAYDLSHGRGVINSKFDKFVSYNHEKLAELDLVGRESDGTPNHFVSVTGFQRLHNGAIWQQYEKTERLANAMYELAKAAVGEEKANEILEQNEIKLLN